MSPFICSAGTTLNLFSDQTSTTLPNSLDITAGDHTFDQDLDTSAAGVNVTVDGGSINFGATQHLASLTVNSGGVASMLVTGGNVLDVSMLSVAGLLDLANNDLIVGSAADSSAVQEEVANGTIFSSTASTDGCVIGVAPASDISITDLDGQSIASTATVARYTLAGDANLDGIVNGSDAALMSAHFNTTTGIAPPAWYEGDFNYDGYVNMNDFGLLGANFNEYAAAPPSSATVGSAFSVNLPTSVPTGSAMRWDVNWGDGFYNSYPAATASVSHAFDAAGPYSVAIQAVTYDSSDGYSVYRAPSTQVEVTASNATVQTFTASPSDNFTLTADGSGDTVVQQNGTTISDLPTADLSAPILSGAASITVDYSQGNPIPAGGIYTDVPRILLTGNEGTSPVIVTATGITVGSSIIMDPNETELDDLLTGIGSIDVLSGAVSLSATNGVGSLGGSVTQLYGNLLVGSGASITLHDSSIIQSLNIAPDASATVVSTNTSMGATVTTVGTLNLDDSDGVSNNGGVLDLGSGDLIVQSPGTSPIQTWLANGYNGGLWDGVNSFGPNPAAITSDAAANDLASVTALGNAIVGSGAGQLNVNAFDGQSVTSGEQVIALTYYGDTNLDRLVNSVDLSNMPTLTSSTTSVAGTWTTGDFDYSGNIDEVDEGLLNDTTIYLTTPQTQAPAVGQIIVNGVAIVINTGASSFRVTGDNSDVNANKFKIEVPKNWTDNLPSKITKTLEAEFKSFTGLSTTTWKQFCVSDANLLVYSVDVHVLAKVQIVYSGATGTHERWETVDVNLTTVEQQNEDPWYLADSTDFSNLNTSLATATANLNSSGVQTALTGLGDTALQQFNNGD